MKLRAILKSKIHRAIVTGADIDYVGSVGVDQDLLDRTDIIPGERVAIWNINNLLPVLVPKVADGEWAALRAPPPL